MQGWSRQSLHKPIAYYQVALKDNDRCDGEYWRDDPFPQTNRGEKVLEA